MASKSKARKGRPTDDDRIVWARAKFTLSDGKRFPTDGDLARRFRRSRNTVSVGIAQALADGLVRVVVHTVPRPGRRDTVLESRIVQRFINGPEAAVVVDAGDVARRQVEDVHETLGATLADFLGDRRDHYFDGGSYAVGGGRGVYHTIRALRQIAPRVDRWAASSVSSLVGAVGRHPIVAPLDAEMVTYDGDSQAAWFGCCFGGGVQANHNESNDFGGGAGTTIKAVAHRVALESRDDAQKALAGTWLSEKDGWVPPHRAILGVGTLSARNRLCRAAAQVDGEQRNPNTKGVAQLMKALMEEVKQLPRVNSEQGGYCPVGDIAHRLFYVPPPSGLGLKRTSDGKIRELITKINERLVVASFEQLQAIPEVILVAGGTSKTSAIHHLLTSADAPKLRVKALCVDSQVAEGLLKF
jgi:DNA-binding transcriptional regulator LsrR (DeoR family)